MLFSHINHSKGQNSHTVFKTLFHFHHTPPHTDTHAYIMHTHTTEQVTRLFPTHLLQHYRVWHRSVLQTGGSCWWSALPLNNRPPPGKHRQCIYKVCYPSTHTHTPKHAHTNQDKIKLKEGKFCWVTLTLQSQTLTNKKLKTISIKHTKRLHTVSSAAISTNYLNILLCLLAISKVNSQDGTKQANWHHAMIRNCVQSILSFFWHENFVAVVFKAQE